jgi:ABC-type multidrug transport system fused ATPase/permease subunit
VLVFGTFQVLDGRLSLGTMLAAALATGFLEPLATLVFTGLQVQLTRSYMARIDDVLDAPRAGRASWSRWPARTSGWPTRSRRRRHGSAGVGPGAAARRPVGALSPGRSPRGAFPGQSDVVLDQ